jgi:hypothetical protein
MRSETDEFGKCLIACMIEDFTNLEKTGIGSVFVRFRTGPMPADFGVTAWSPRWTR